MKSNPLRAEAGILYVLDPLADEGHVYYPFGPLVETCGEMLSVEPALVERALWTLASEKRFAIEELGNDSGKISQGFRAVYLSKRHIAETTIASRLMALVAVTGENRVDPERAVEWVRRRLSIQSYGECLDYAVKRAWVHWTCLQCGKRFERESLEEVAFTSQDTVCYYNILLEGHREP